METSYDLRIEAERLLNSEKPEKVTINAGQKHQSMTFEFSKKKLIINCVGGNHGKGTFFYCIEKVTKKK